MLLFEVELKFLEKCVATLKNSKKNAQTKAMNQMNESPWECVVDNGVVITEHCFRFNWNYRNTSFKSQNRNDRAPQDIRVGSNFSLYPGAIQTHV